MMNSEARKRHQFGEQGGEPWFSPEMDLSGRLSEAESTLARVRRLAEEWNERHFGPSSGFASELLSLLDNNGETQP